MTDNPAASPNASPYRVLAWWDVDMYIGAYKKHKVTARPLRDLERIIGHKLHVESRWSHSRLPDGLRKLEAYNYIDTADPALAAFFVLHQLSGLSEWFYGIGYKPVRSPADDDFDADTICAFYWYDRDHGNSYRHILSGGVLLRLDRKPPARANDWSRPVLRINRIPEKKDNYCVEIVIEFFCKNRQKLIEHYWPNLLKKYAIRPEDHVDFGPSPNEGKLNHIFISAVLEGTTEHVAVAYCLARTERCRFKLGGPEGAIFQAERFPDQEPFDGTFSISLRRKENA